MEAEMQVSVILFKSKIFITDFKGTDFSIRNFY